MTDQRTVLAWVDLETTGLKPIPEHRILEYAVVFTDLHLNELDCMTSVIPQDVAFARSLMDDYVVEMHTKNGLLEELEAVERNTQQGYNTSLYMAQKKILAKFKSVEVRDHVNDYDVVFVIAGSTVKFDKDNLEYHMPGVFETLHYRQLDVSSHKVGFPEVFGTKTSANHRAMDDIRASIAVQSKMRRIMDFAIESDDQLVDKS